MTRRYTILLALIFAFTGFSSLSLQVIWQRIVSLHSGVDLASATTVVASFLAGLGIGGLVGGAIADALGQRWSLLGLAAANLLVGGFSWLSVWVLYDLYRQAAPYLDSNLKGLMFNAAILLVPTTLMGMSLPLVARSVVRERSTAGQLIARLYGLNTIGAALGSMVTGWFLLGTIGFENSVRLAGSINVAMAVAAFALGRRHRPEPVGHSARVTRGEEADVVGGLDPTTTSSQPVDAAARVRGSHTIWYVAYGLTGAVSLGFEQVFFRTIDAVMRSNSYSFAHVLALYLLLFGLGSAAGSRLVHRAIDPRKWFLWIQYLAGLSALVPLIVLTRVLPVVGVGDRLKAYFEGEGYNGGFGEIETARQWLKLLAIYGVIPIGIMGMPVLLMGVAFPFIQSLVVDRVDTVGRNTGKLFFANTVGNVAGTIATGFLLLDRLGTAGTYRTLATILAAAGLPAVLLTVGSRRLVASLAVTVLAVGTLAVAPTNRQLWAFLHGTNPNRILIAEDHSCAAAIRLSDSGQLDLFINASVQNGYPFTDFHLLIGIMPVVVQPAPSRALAIGLGIGSTAYGMLRDPRVQSLDTVELCGGEYELLANLAQDRTRPEFASLVEDPRVREHVGDGRKFLLATDSKYDVITVDTLRTTSAYSGSLYSVEFYELVSSRLADTGVMAQWVPSPRVANSAAEVFPYIVAFSVESYDGSVFMLASKSPLSFDRGVVLERLATATPHSLSPEQTLRIEKFVREVGVDCYANGVTLEGVPSRERNTDLRPRDEYFVNNRSGRQLARC